MEVHKPHTIHSLREFLKEVGIIVLGVVIALAAEQAVEAIHWRNKVSEAAESMRLELRDDDGPQAFARAVLGPCFDQQLDTIEAAVNSGHDRRAITALADAYAPPVHTWDTDAWKAALASDAASHTSAERMVTWSKPYRLMAVLEATNLAENSERLQLQSTRHSAGSLSPAEQDRMLSAIVRLRGANHKMAQWSRFVLLGLSRNGISVTPSVQARILQGFRERYGDCAVEPSFRGLDPNDQLSGAAEPVSVAKSRLPTRGA
jgi:hypothetical protein